MNDLNITRREFLKAGTSGAALICGAAVMPATAFAGDKPYGPFRVGLQSYTLRAFNFDDAIAMTKALDIHYWESFQAHIGKTQDKVKIKETLAKLKQADIHLTSWGVEDFTTDEKKARSTFEFAKLIGIETISANPVRESFDLLDKLVAEYKINVAIHNHGPGARWDKLQPLTAALRGHHPRLGVCVDTGHVLRSSEDPVDWVKTLGARVLDVHLKDVKNANQFTEIGQGDLRTTDIFKELLKLKYRGAVHLEYEEHEKDPGQYVSVCLAATRDAIQKALRK